MRVVTHFAVVISARRAKLAVAVRVATNSPPVTDQLAADAEGVGEGDRQIPMAAAVLAEVRLERVGEVVDVDHGPRQPGLDHAIEAPVDQRLAGHRNERLGPGRGERAHPLAEPGRHDHRGIAGEAAHASLPPPAASKGWRRR